MWPTLVGNVLRASRRNSFRYCAHVIHRPNSGTMNSYMGKNGLSLGVSIRARERWFWARQPAPDSRQPVCRGTGNLFDSFSFRCAVAVLSLAILALRCFMAAPCFGGLVIDRNKTCFNCRLKLPEVPFNAHPQAVEKWVFPPTRKHLRLCPRYSRGTRKNRVATFSPWQCPVCPPCLIQKLSK